LRPGDQADLGQLVRLAQSPRAARNLDLFGRVRWYAAEYREAHPLPSRPCVVCGKPFSGRPDALVCGPECRQQRKLEQCRASFRLP